MAIYTASKRVRFAKTRAQVFHASNWIERSVVSNSVRKSAAHFEENARCTGLLASESIYCWRWPLRSALVQFSPSPGLPPEKWSSLMYGLWPDGGLKNGKEETYG